MNKFYQNLFQVDEVERSVREVNKILGETPNIRVGFNKVKSQPQIKNILSVEHRNLNPNNELKRIFGSKIVQNDQKFVFQKHYNIINNYIFLIYIFIN